MSSPLPPRYPLTLFEASQKYGVSIRQLVGVAGMGWAPLAVRRQWHSTRVALLCSATRGRRPSEATSSGTRCGGGPPPAPLYSSVLTVPRQQLTRYVEQYPTHSKISYGRNLLGRAFLDDRMPEDAARWFLKNYQANKAGERAPDSLLYLGASMVALGDTKRACIALAEFSETYPLVAAGRLATEFQTTRAKVKCS